MKNESKATLKTLWLLFSLLLSFFFEYAPAFVFIFLLYRRDYQLTIAWASFMCFCELRTIKHHLKKTD